MNKKRAKTFVLAVALCGLLISILGCENTTTSPIGGAENRPITDFVGKTYKGEWESFSVTKEGDSIVLTIGAEPYQTKGKSIDSKFATTGTVYLLECSHHNNYDNYQYPDYDTKGNHSGCFHPVYIRSINDKTVEWATFYTSVEGKPTACFSLNSKAKAQEYLDFTKWDPPTAYSTGTVVQ